MPTLNPENFAGETTNSSGTGTTVTLTGALSGHVTWASRYSVGATGLYYMRWDSSGAYEECTGTLTNSTTITRTAIHKSSNGGAAVNWAPGGTQNVTCAPGAGQVLLKANSLAEMSAGEIIAARTSLGLGTAAVLAASQFGLLEGQTGGTSGKVVRPTTTANTWTDAANTDTAAQLAVLGFKTAAGIYLPGSRVPGLSVTTGQFYWLGTAGAMLTSPPTPGGSLRRVDLGIAISTGEFLFAPSLLVGG